MGISRLAGAFVRAPHTLFTGPYQPAAAQSTSVLFRRYASAMASSHTTSVARAVRQFSTNPTAAIYGKTAWEKYFGNVDVTTEPPLRSDMEAIWASPCPVKGKGYTIADTHSLVLVPPHVRMPYTGEWKPLILSTLGELVQRPRGGGNATRYNQFQLGVYPDLPTEKAHWSLICSYPLDRSRYQTYPRQAAMVQELAKRVQIPYEVPAILDMTVYAFMAYTQAGYRPFGTDPMTYIRCREPFNSEQGCQMTIGGFSRDGLNISYLPCNSGAEYAMTVMWRI